MQMHQKPRIVIVDDHAIMRDGLRMLLNAGEHADVVGEADNGLDALNIIAELQPDIVLMDLSLPHINGTQAIGDIKQQFPGTKVIAFTSHKAEEYVHAALYAGADGYILKEDSHADLLLALRSVSQGKRFLSPGVCEDIISRYLQARG